MVEELILNAPNPDLGEVYNRRNLVNADSVQVLAANPELAAHNPLGYFCWLREEELVKFILENMKNKIPLPTWFPHWANTNLIGAAFRLFDWRHCMTAVITPELPMIQVEFKPGYTVFLTTEKGHEAKWKTFQHKHPTGKVAPFAEFPCPLKSQGLVQGGRSMPDDLRFYHHEHHGAALQIMDMVTVLVVDPACIASIRVFTGNFRTRQETPLGFERY